MNWHYKVNIWLFWIKVICLSFGAAGFWAMVFFGLLSYVFKVQPSSNNVYGIYLVWTMLFIAFFPISANALYRLTVKQTNGKFQMDFFTQSKSKWFHKP